MALVRTLITSYYIVHNQQNSTTKAPTKKESNTQQHSKNIQTNPKKTVLFEESALKHS